MFGESKERNTEFYVPNPMYQPGRADAHIEAFIMDVKLNAATVVLYTKQPCSKHAKKHDSCTNCCTIKH
jgi:hypothetical protein